MQVVDQHPYPIGHRQPVHASPSYSTNDSDADEARVVREKVLRGLEEVAAGRVLSGDVVEAECEALFG
ncbi:hypothetical protein [Pandoraea fibrosis]|uniref:Uncharacterized protein n=1 Tax=Pandoraea fibrosis TaxID=1891094 RepID=A0A5E4VR09_9BURK|nr:hypothetical protein [Pandoraea fibrosis]VVE14788.1 hypothetical protein PFI31113_02793 [Pandoraea fibrosis]